MRCTCLHKRKFVDVCPDNNVTVVQVRLTETKLLPSSGSELVTMMRLPFFNRGIDLSSALRISGRLITRNSASTFESGTVGVMNPAAWSRPKSILWTFGPAAVSSDNDGSVLSSFTLTVEARVRMRTWLVREFCGGIESGEGRPSPFPRRAGSDFNVPGISMPAFLSSSSRFAASSMVFIAPSERKKAKDENESDGRTVCCQ